MHPRTRTAFILLVLPGLICLFSALASAAELGQMTWEFGPLTNWTVTRPQPSAMQGKDYLIKTFRHNERKWSLEQLEYACTECSSYKELRNMLSPNAKVTGKGHVGSDPALYYEQHEDSGLLLVAAVAGDHSRALRVTLRTWPTGTRDAAELKAELLSLLKQMKRIPADAAPGPAEPQQK